MSFDYTVQRLIAHCPKWPINQLPEPVHGNYMLSAVLSTNIRNKHFSLIQYNPLFHSYWAFQFHIDINLKLNGQSIISALYSYGSMEYSSIV